MREGGWAARVCVLAMLSGCAALPGTMEPLNVTLADVKPAQFGLLEQEYAMKIRVQNPNGREIPVQGLSFALDLNSKPFAKGVSSQAVTIPAFGEVLLDVKAISTLGGLLDQLGTLREGPPERITYRLQGRLAPGGGSSLPFDSSGALDLSALTGEPTR